MGPLKTVDALPVLEDIDVTPAVAVAAPPESAAAATTLPVSSSTPTPLEFYAAPTRILAAVAPVSDGAVLQPSPLQAGRTPNGPPPVAVPVQRVDNASPEAFHARAFAPIPAPPPPAPAPPPPAPPPPVPPPPPAMAAAPPIAALPPSLSIASAEAAEHARPRGLDALIVRMDAGLYGHRGKVVVGVLALFLAVPVIGGSTSPEGAALNVASWLLLLVMTVVLGGARILSLRDEDGKWRVGVVFRRLQSFLEGVVETVGNVASLPAPERRRAISTAVAFLGLVLLTLARLLDAITSAPGYLVPLGVGTLLIAAVLRLIKVASPAGAVDLVVKSSDAAQLSSLADAVRRLPPLLDARAPDYAALAQDAGHPLLRGLLECFLKWPSRGYEFEDQYQSSLDRYLRKNLPSAKPQREYPVNVEGERGRIDFMLGEVVAIEMKRQLSTATADRAVGQVRRYLALTKGPVVLLLCDAETARARTLIAPAVAELRLTGRAVVAIIARH